jgi:N-acetylglucosamine-6-phosphate deacetylase
MRDAVDYVVNVLTIPLADALMMATLTPARLLRVDARIRQLKPGHRAISCIFRAEVWTGGCRSNEVDAAE